MYVLGLGCMYFRMLNRPQNSLTSVTKPTQIDLQVDPKSSQNWSREGMGAFGRSQVRPKSAKRAPKSCPGVPRECPEASQVRLGVLKRSLKRVPRRPKTAKNRSQVTLGSQVGDMARSSFALHA